MSIHYKLHKLYSIDGDMVSKPLTAYLRGIPTNSDEQEKELEHLVWLAEYKYPYPSLAINATYMVHDTLLKIFDIDCDVTVKQCVG